MANWWWFTKVHRAVYRATGGRVGGRLLGFDMCLLTTRGRRSGLERTVPLACFRRGKDVILVASNNGQDHPPAWWLNLKSRPDATIRLDGEKRAVHAAVAGPDERAELWPWIKERHRFLQHHAEKTDREIPVVILRPRGETLRIVD